MSLYNSWKKQQVSFPTAVHSIHFRFNSYLTNMIDIYVRTCDMTKHMTVIFYMIHKASKTRSKHGRAQLLLCLTFASLQSWSCSFFPFMLIPLKRVTADIRNYLTTRVLTFFKARERKRGLACLANSSCLGLSPEGRDHAENKAFLYVIAMPVSLVRLTFWGKCGPANAYFLLLFFKVGQVFHGEK